MESTGSKIAELRKKKNLTQAELGEKLNISAQAVSKWEKDLSEPDISTLNKLCEIFEVGLDEIAGNKKKQPVVKQQVVKSEEPIIQNKILLANCSKCGKGLYSRNDYSVRDNGNGATIVCNKCLKKEELNRKISDYKEELKMFKWGLGVGIPVSIILLVVCLVFDPLSLGIGARIGIGVACLYVAFTFVSQLFYSETIQDIIVFFKRSYGLPGIIWEFSIDGFIKMILMKWLLGFLASLLSTTVFLFGAVITSIISAFTYPFTLVAFIRARASDNQEIKRLRQITK